MKVVASIFLCLFVLCLHGCSQLPGPESVDYAEPEHTSIAAAPLGIPVGMPMANDLKQLCSAPSSFQMPSGFASRSLEECTGVFEDDVENGSCPLRRKVLLVRIAPPKTSINANDLACEGEQWDCEIPNDVVAVDRFNTYLAGVNRFEVVTTQTRLFNWATEMQRLAAPNSELEMAALKGRKTPRKVDYVVNIVPVIQKSTQVFDQPGTFASTKYQASFRTQVLDPTSLTVSSDISVPEVVLTREKSSLLDMEEGSVSYKGFDPTNPVLDEAVYDEIYGNALVTIAGHLMDQFPAVARVSALNDRFVVLDRGRLEGISEAGETMLVFQKLRQVAVPILLAAVQPSQSGASGGSQGTIACWDSSTQARSLMRVAAEGELSGLDRKLYAVSIGPPPGKRF